MTAILAAGDFPRKGSVARRILETATRVVCCDSAADTYKRRLKREPTVVIGDCDSVKGRFRNVVRIAEQDTNDLEKAIRHCREKRWKNPVVLGATGKRADHAIGNLFRAMEAGLEIVTDRGTFFSVGNREQGIGNRCGRGYSLRLRVGVGTAVSVFAPPGTRMTSEGLEWPLKGVTFENFHCATLNRANRPTIVLTSTKPAYAFVAS